MITKKVKELTVENFREYGTFADMLHPEQYKPEGASIKFYRELVGLNLGYENNIWFSTLKVKKRPLIVDATEYHARCSEGVFPIDGDILIHVGPGVKAGAEIPVEKMEIFRIPRGTMVNIRPGVWHYEPFAVEQDVVNALIILPERTYGNDLFYFELPDEKRIAIEL